LAAGRYGLRGAESGAQAVVFPAFLCHNAALRRPAKGLPWRRFVPQHSAQFRAFAGEPGLWRAFPAQKESQMPKIKTKSGAKKRFKITGTGKVVAAHAGKRHGMIKRTKKQIRQLRGTDVLFKTDGDNIKKYWMPNG
jgi:large subunit ribosomal protein L35